MSLIARIEERRRCGAIIVKEARWRHIKALTYDSCFIDVCFLLGRRNWEGEKAY